jgi:hypothetical protein
MWRHLASSRNLFHQRYWALIPPGSIGGAIEKVQSVGISSEPKDLHSKLQKNENKMAKSRVANKFKSDYTGLDLVCSILRDPRVL